MPTPPTKPARPLRLRTALIVASALAVTACTTVPRDGGYTSVAADTTALFGAAPAWPRSAAAEVETQRIVDDLLSRELTPESATRIALLNSPRVRAAMEGLGIARAEFLVATRPPNPIVSALALDRHGQPGPPDLQFSVALPILDLLLLPQRSRVGQAAFEVARANAASAVVEGVVKTRSGLADYIALRQIADFHAQAADAARVGQATAQAIYDAGNTPKVELDREKLFAAETAAEAMRAQAAVQPARESLNALLGLSGARADGWTSAIRLPPLPTAAMESSTFEAQAVAFSFGLKLADARLRAAAARRGIANIESVLQNLEPQYQYNRDDDTLKRGGGLSLTLPIFGFGHAERLRASSELRQAIQERRAVEVEVRARARSIAARTEAARQLAVFRRQTVLPLSNDVYAGTLLDSNAGQIGLFQLLQAKRDNLRAGREYIEALRDYWSARTDLGSLFAMSAIAGSSTLSPPSAGAMPSGRPGTAASPGASPPSSPGTASRPAQGPSQSQPTQTQAPAQSAPTGGQ